MRFQWLLTRRSLAANKLRFLLTMFSVTLGVSFVVSSFVLTDGLLNTFDTIVEDANAEVDAEIRSRSDFSEIEFTDRPFDESLLETVAAVDGVDEAVPIHFSFKVVPIKADGEPVETTGAPIFAFSWSDSQLSAVSIVEGEAPDEPGEFALDETTAGGEGFVIGETYDVVASGGREPFTLVGTTRFGEENALAGAVLASFTLDEVQRLDDSEGLLTYIDVSAEPGVDPEVLITRLEAALPSSVEAIGNTQLVDEAQEDFSGIIDIFGNILLAFALVAVFVSTFIITNTFNILLGQRVRQLALLRALGASARQVRTNTFLEALIVGVVASLVGLAGGALLAYALRAVMDSLGFSLPSFDLIISPRTVVVALIVGIGVTLLASVSPAKRAASVPPIAALRSGFRFGSGEGTRRTIIAIILSVFGVLALGYGLFGGSDNTALLLSALGLGAVLVFVAISMFSPLFSSPAARALGAPLEFMPGKSNITGHMARGNAARNNKRTASTAAGLMIGLALIAMATVVATSLKDSFRDELGSTLIGDYLVTEDSGVGFSNQLVDRVEALPEFETVSAVRYGTVRIDGDDKGMAATDLTVLTDLLDVGILAGDPAASADVRSLVLTQEAADDHGVSVGDRLDIEFAAVGTMPFTVSAIYDNEFLIGHYIIDLASWDANFVAENDNVISALTAPGVDAAAAEAALAPLQNSFPQLNFESRQDFSDRVEGQLDSLLAIINVFLGLAIIIALLGITNTMALVVLERTQEIGLMRAIGMTRRQTRSLIRLEAGVVSLFGALLGVVVGLVFGWLAVIAIPDSIINRLSIPGSTLVIYVVVATVAGLLAASFPARRASRLNILDAIAHL